MQTESTKATSSRGARTVGAGKRLETIVRPTARPSARSRLAPYTPASPAPGSASAPRSRASHTGSQSSVSLWRKQRTSVSASRQARLSAAITPSLAGLRAKVSGYGYGKRSKNSGVPSVEPLSMTTSRNGSVVARRLSRQARVSREPPRHDRTVPAGRHGQRLHGRDARVLRALPVPVPADLRAEPGQRRRDRGAQPRLAARRHGGPLLSPQRHGAARPGVALTAPQGPRRARRRARGLLRRQAAARRRPGGRPDDRP